MKLSKCLSFLVLIYFPILAQNGNGESDYRRYILPVFPNQTNTLAGTMGELRNTHFHTGIDIRTQGKTGLPIVAAADGYINRISVQGTGYGNALYIQHADGNITVYAHLNNFNDEIAEFVRQEQYKRQKFEINLFPAQNQFPVRQGDLIALSGNSGSSVGPHLHFDLRDENQNLLNPLEYGFHEVIDDIPPVARKIAVSTLDINSRIAGEFGRMEFDLIRQGDKYTVADTLLASGLIGLEIYAYDRQNYTFFRTGIPTFKVFINKQQVFNQNIIAFSFSDQKHINVHTNYQKKVDTGRSFAKLYIDDGNELPFFQAFNKGKIKVTEGVVLPVTFELKDTYNNSTIVEFFIKGQKSAGSYKSTSKISSGIRSEIKENTLIIRCNKDSLFNNQLKYFSKGMESLAYPAYITGNGSAVFLFDLRKVLVDFVSISNSKKYYNFKAMVPSGIPYSFYSNSIDINFSRNSLFDTVFLATRYFVNDNNQEIFHINENTEPLKNSIKVTLKTRNSYPSKTEVYTIDSKGNLGYMGGSWDGKSIIFSTTSFGDYTLATDSIPPVIRPVIVNSNNLTFIIEDKMSGIKEFRAMVNGKWLLMNYDPKKNLIWSEKLKPETRLAGDVILKVTDKAGNESIYQTKL